MEESEIIKKIENLYFNYDGMTDKQFQEYLKLMIKFCNIANQKEQDFEFYNEFGSLESNIWSIKNHLNHIKEYENQIKKYKIKDFDSKEQYENTIKFIKEEEIGYNQRELSWRLKIMSLKQFQTAYSILQKYMLENGKTNVILNCFDYLDDNYRKNAIEYFISTKDVQSLLSLAQKNGNIYKNIHFAENLKNMICEKKDKIEYYRFLTYYANDLLATTKDLKNMKGIYTSEYAKKYAEYVGFLKQSGIAKQMTNELMDMIERDKDFKLCENIIFGRIDKKYENHNEEVSNVCDLFDKRRLIKFYCEFATDKQINNLFDNIKSYRKTAEDSKHIIPADKIELC